MTKQEMLRLWAVPADIRTREKRIRALETLIEEAGTVSDTVQSSTDAGNATVLCHAVVSGKVDTTTAEEKLRRLKQGLLDKNAALRRDYPRAVEIIESCADPALRAAAHLRCIEGESWEDIAGRLGFGSADSWRQAVGKFAGEATKKL